MITPGYFGIAWCFSLPRRPGGHDGLDTSIYTHLSTGHSLLFILFSGVLPGNLFNRQPKNLRERSYCG